MKCYNRHDDGVFLWSCMLEDKHSGDHSDCAGKTWTDEQGWYDQYGEVKRKLCGAALTWTDGEDGYESKCPNCGEHRMGLLLDPRDFPYCTKVMRP